MRRFLGVLFLLALSAPAALAGDVREVVLAEGTKWETRAFVRRGAEPGPVVMVVGGIHGDEVAGFRAADQIRHWPIERGCLVVLPRANTLGLAAGRRTVPAALSYDLNRRFPPATGNPGPLEKAIWELAESHHPDWLIDLHESVDYRYRTSKARKTLGRSLIFLPNPETEAMARRMADAPNAAIEDQRFKWVLLTWPIKGSLARAAGERLGSRTIIAETSRKSYLAIRVRGHRQVVHRLLTDLTMLPKDFSPHTFYAGPPRHGEIRVAIYNSSGTGGTSAWQIERCLTPLENVSCHRVSAAAIRAGALRQFDVVAFPGGTGSGKAKALTGRGLREVREFVRRGGGYLGICAGAYLATSHYSWSLGILDAKVLDSAHWARGTGTVRMGLTREGMGLFQTERRTVAVRYAQGPLLAPAGNDDIPDFEVLARYETEIAKNGVPKGVMVGTPAIVRGLFGKGRVVVASPHPESSKDAGLRDYVRRAVRWLARK